MSIIRNSLVLIIILVLAAGCATVQEKRAFSDWKEEGQRFSGNGVEDENLPELGENATLDDYVLYAMLNNPGLHAAFDRWKAALEKVAPARTLPDPRFTYANYIKEVETRSGRRNTSLVWHKRFRGSENWICGGDGSPGRPCRTSAL